MSKEILKGIFEENIAPVREDITFEGWVDKIKDNEEYKVGLFENYVQPSMPDATFEDFNAETFGLGKVEAPLGGAQSEESVSPTESVSSEFEVGPPGVEPKGAPVEEAAALVGEVESEGEPKQDVEPAIITKDSLLDVFTFEDEKNRKSWWEKVVDFFTGGGAKPKRVIVGQETFDRLKARQDEEIKKAEEETGEKVDLFDVIQDFVTVSPEEQAAFLMSIQRGLIQGQIAERMRLGETPTREDIIEIARLNKEQRGLKSSKSYERFNEAPFGEAVKIFLQDPLEIGGQIILESGAALARHGYSRALLGGGTGAAMGSVVPGIGTAAGFGTGVVSGLGVAGFNLEMASSILESFEEAGVDITNQYSLESAFSDEETLKKARDFALKRSVPIALFDLFSAGVAGKIAKFPAKSIAKRVAKQGVEMTAQAGLAGTGEAAAQVVSGQKFNPNAILAEMIGETTMAVPEIAVGQMIENKKEGKSIKPEAVKIDTPVEAVRDMVDISVGAGLVTSKEANEIVDEYGKVQEVKKSIPENLRNNEEVVSAIEEKKKLEEEKKNLDPIFVKGVDEKIAALDAKIEGIVSGAEAAPVEGGVAKEGVSPETAEAPKVEIIVKRRQKLNKDRTKLVPTGGFDYFAKVGDKEVKLSDAEYKAYKESGVLPESVSAVEVAPEVEGEAVTPEAVAPEVPALRDVESTAKALEGVENIKDVFSKVKTFAIKGLKDFFHASPQKRIGRLRKGLAQQFGVGVYFSTNKDLVTNEFGENVTNVSLVLSNPVFTNTPEWIEVKKRAIKMADDAYGKEKGLTLEEDESYFRYDPEDTSEIDEIPANFISEAANEMGYDAIVDEGSTTYENEISVLDDSKIVYEEDIPSYLSEAYHKAKEDGSNPELVSAVEELLGQPTQTPEVAEGQPAEVISPEVAEALSTEDATRIVLESLEALPEGIESAEEGARIYHEAIGKEERTEAEDAIVMAVEDAVIGGAVATEETPIDYEVASSNVEETTKALGTKSAEKLNSIKEKISQAETRKFEDDERKQATTRTDRGVQEVQPSGGQQGARDVSGQDRALDIVTTEEEFKRNSPNNGEQRALRRNGKPVIGILYTGHVVPFDKFSRSFRGTGIGNQGGGVFFTLSFDSANKLAKNKAKKGAYSASQSGYAFQTEGAAPYVSEVKISGDNFVFFEEAIPTDVVKQVGVINGVNPANYEKWSEFYRDLYRSFLTEEEIKNGSITDAQTKASDALSEKGITGHVDSFGEVVVYSEKDIVKTRQARIYESNAELISDQYHKAKADGSNPELVKAVDELLGKPAEAVETVEAVETAEGKEPSDAQMETKIEEVSAPETAEKPKPAEGLTSKEKAEQANKRAEEIAKKIRKNLRGRGGITGITPFSRAKRLAEVDRATLKLIKDYIYQKALAGAYTFKDFVEDMKQNSKRLFGVQIKVFSEDERIFDAGKALFEIDDTFAQEIMKLKDDFISSINNNPSSAGLNFDKFVAANQALVSGFIQAAESQYGLNNTQATSLVRSMYYDAISSVAGTKQSFETIQDIKDFHKKINDAEILNDALDVVRTEDIRRRLNVLSRTWNAFVDAFVSPTRTFDDIFRNVKDRLSLEREVYASRKSRMGSSTKAGNWYNDVHKKIYGGLSWSEIRELNKFLVYRRIREVKQLRDARVIEYNDLEKDLLVPGITDKDKAKIEKRMAELKELGLGRVMSGSVIVNGKRENFEDYAADYAAGIEASDSASATKIKERAKLYTDANNELLKMRLDAGLISQEAYKSMFDKDYVRRVFLDLSASTLDAVSFPSISGQIRAIKSGSEEKFLLMDTQSLLQLSAAVTFSSVDKNRFMQKVAAWTENNQPVFLDKVLDSYKKAFEKKNGRQPTQDEIDKFTKEQTLFMLRRKNQAKPVGFELNTYYVNGKEKILAVRNDLQGVFDTPTGREGVKGRMKGFIDFMSVVNLTGILKSSAVFYNPAFALKNFARDLLHASLVTTDLYKSFSFNLATILAKATGYTAENVYSKAINGFNSLFARSGRRDSKFDRLVKDYFAHGGGMSNVSAPSTRMYTNSLMSDKLERARSEFVKGGLKFLNVLNSLQSGSELITRIIVYEAALNNNIKEYKKKNGIEPTGNDLTSLKESAAASAADLIDFREGTTITKSFDATIFPFMNAMVQGSRITTDFIRKNPGTAMLRLTEFGGMALAVALYNVNSGDEDEKEGVIGYNGISEYTKSNYLVFMMPYTKKNEKGEIVRPYFSWPLTTELKATNIMVNSAVSKQDAKKSVGQFVEAIKGGYIPDIGAASPTVQIAMALRTNKDMFKKGAPIYRSREEVLLPDRFNVGETKKIYRDLFKAFYDFGNEDGEDKGILGFDEAGPAQWQAAFEKAISPNNPYYLFLTSTYATVSELAGEKNEREVKALFDEQMSSLNSLTMGLYREPQSSIQQKNIKNKEELEFLEKQIGSWRKKNDDLITAVVAKKLRDIDNNPDLAMKEYDMLNFFQSDIFNYISDKEIERTVKAQGIKKLPEDFNRIIDFVVEEESRMMLKLYEEFKPNSISKYPSLKNYKEVKKGILELEQRTEAIEAMRDEYLTLPSNKRIEFLISLTFVAGDDFEDIVSLMGVDEESYDNYSEILRSAEADAFKEQFLRTEDKYGQVSSEPALNKMLLIMELMKNK